MTRFSWSLRRGVLPARLPLPCPRLSVCVHPARGGDEAWYSVTPPALTRFMRLDSHSISSVRTFTILHTTPASTHLRRLSPHLFYSSFSKTNGAPFPHSPHTLAMPSHPQQTTYLPLPTPPLPTLYTLKTPHTDTFLHLLPPFLPSRHGRKYATPPPPLPPP